MWLISQEVVQGFLMKFFKGGIININPDHDVIQDFFKENFTTAG